VLTIRGDKSHITLRGLVLDGARAIRQHVLLLYQRDGKAPQHIRVEQCEIKNGRSSGILAAASHSQYVKLKVHHNGSDRCDHGIYVLTSNNLIDGCEFSHNSGFGIHVYNTTWGTDHNVVRNNYAHHNGVAGAIVGTGQGNQAYNNVLAFNRTGLLVRGTDTRIYHNTIYGNSSAGMDVTGTTNAQIKNNIVYRSSAVTGRVGRGGAPTNTGLVEENNLLDVDPCFVNAESGDFRLTAGNPAIGAGVSLELVPVDRDGRPRRAGHACDVGAYQFVAGEPPRADD
jgi:parallel beta-helix repeat protein